MFNKESKLKDIIKNPIGRDIANLILSQKQLDIGWISNPIIGNIKLKNLNSLSKGLVNQDFIDMICSKLNLYEDNLIEPSAKEIRPTWWKEAVAYQIYPRSFCDSNNDGIGDLGGIISKLDYLKELGIDLIWLSPIYDSPNDDNGYDIRDYKKIMDEFGTMDDFDNLLNEVHKRDMRLIMDLVINHTSDEHEWFIESKSSKSSPYRNYYIWRDGTFPGKEPNNWTSFFSGKAWNYDKNTDQWSLHLFSKKQMDLNWDYEPMRNELYSMINWWLDKGIDGFRLDVINYISKEPGLPDGNELIGEMMGITGAEHYFFGPKVHNYLQELNCNTFANYDAVTVGETPGIGLEMSQYFTHESRKELDMIFNFEHLMPPGKNKFDYYQYDLNILKSIMLKWQTEYNNQCWNSLFFENHDNPRIISKVNTAPEFRVKLGKLLAMMLLSLKGTPFIYQGQELGMVNADFGEIEDFRDVESINLYKELLEKGEPKEKVLKMLRWGSRDNSRVPMPWNGSLYGGFSGTEPWILESENYKTINVEDSVSDKNSVYNFYKQMIALRHKYKALVYGEFEAVNPKQDDIFCYYRKSSDECLLVVMNLSSTDLPFNLDLNKYELLLGSYKEVTHNSLQPYECRLYITQK